MARRCRQKMRAIFPIHLARPQMQKQFAHQRRGLRRLPIAHAGHLPCGDAMRTHAQGQILGMEQLRTGKALSLGPVQPRHARQRLLSHDDDAQGGHRKVESNLRRFEAALPR